MSYTQSLQVVSLYVTGIKINAGEVVGLLADAGGIKK